MLAYVFSHRPAPGVDVTVYEEALRRFHAALASAPSAGFVSSTTYRTGDAYSDWYLVESSASLDWLNAAAISGARTPAHDAAARMAVDGSGKLLSLAGGDVPQGPGFEIRFAKPAPSAALLILRDCQARKSERAKNKISEICFHVPFSKLSDGHNDAPVSPLVSD